MSSRTTSRLLRGHADAQQPSDLVAPDFTGDRRPVRNLEGDGRAPCLDDAADRLDLLFDRRAGSNRRRALRREIDRQLRAGLSAVEPRRQRFVRREDEIRQKDRRLVDVWIWPELAAPVLTSLLADVPVIVVRSVVAWPRLLASMKRLSGFQSASYRTSRLRVMMSSGGPSRPSLVIVHPAAVRATETCSLPIGIARRKIVKVEAAADPAGAAVCCAAAMPATAAIAPARTLRTARLE